MNKIDVIGEVRVLLKNRDPEKFTIMAVVDGIDTLKELSSQEELRHGFIITPQSYNIDEIPKDETDSTTTKPQCGLLIAMNEVHEHKNKHLLPFDVILLPFGFKVVLKKALELLKPDGLLIVKIAGFDEQTLREQALTAARARQTRFAEPTIKAGSDALVFDFSKPVLAPEIKLPAPLLSTMAKML